MEIKRKKVSLKEEQRIVTNLITSTEFCKLTKGVVHSYLLKSTYAKIVAGWCLEYYEQTETAPGLDIQDVYIRKRKELEDEEEVETISEFIQTLSNQWEDLQINNAKYEYELAKKYMKLRQLEQLREQLDVSITQGEPEQGEHALSKYKDIRETQISGVDLFNDDKKVQLAFEKTEEVLFSLQGDLGKVLGPFCRGDFIAGLGGPKSTKSFHLYYIARRAAMLGFNVVIGNWEMSENQYLRRAWQSLQGLPSKTKKVKLPYFEQMTDREYSIQYREEQKDGIDTVNVVKKQEYYKKHTKGGNVRILTFTSGVSTLSDMISEIDSMEYYENYKPDVIIFDYADIIASEIKGDKRHQIDDIWVKIRGLAQEKNCLCATVSQVNSTAWGKDIKGKDADENKKKAAHVTKMYAINSTPEEIEKGVVRVQSLFQREGKAYYGQVTVLQSLEIGRWYLDSKFRKNIIIEDDE